MLPSVPIHNLWWKSDLAANCDSLSTKHIYWQKEIIWHAKHSPLYKATWSIPRQCHMPRIHASHICPACVKYHLVHYVHIVAALLSSLFILFFVCFITSIVCQYFCSYAVTHLTKSEPTIWNLNWKVTRPSRDSAKE